MFVYCRQLDLPPFENRKKMVGSHLKSELIAGLTAYL